MAERYDPVVHRTALVVAVLTFGLLIAGGLVTSRNAGLAVPDWPLSFGSLNPPRWYAIENVRTEHGHRLVAGTVALATLLLGLVVWRRESRRWVRRLTAVAALGVLLQALLGGLRVLELSVDLAMVHGVVAQLFFATVVTLAVVTSPRWEHIASMPPPSPRVFRSALAASLLIFLQLVVAVRVRHLGVVGGALATNPFFLAHVALACAIAWFCLRMPGIVERGALSCLTNPQLAPPARLLASALVAQLALGLLSFAVTVNADAARQATALESWIPTLHLAVGGVLMATSVVLSVRAWAAGRSSVQPLDEAIAQPVLAESRG